MERIAPVAWTDDDRALWARLVAHDFEHAGVALTFADRLARDHGWSLGRARAAIDEYRRFCFLALRAGREVTPSEEVDEVWHQHLTFSRDYWLVWCRDVLRRDLHHGPTLGGPAEGRRFAEQYAETLAAYEAWFGPPPVALWPGTAERFARPRFRLVDRATHVVVPVPREVLARLRRFASGLGLGALLALLSTRRAEAAAFNPLDWTAGPFLSLYVTLACASLATAWRAASSIAEKEARPVERTRLSSAELGLLVGGKPRATDVLILEDIAAGRIGLETREGRLGPIPFRKTVLTAFGQDVDRTWLASQREQAITDLRHGLVEDGLLMAQTLRQSIRRTTTAFVGPVILLGLAKIAVGIGRDKPVGILFFLVIVTAIAGLALAESRSLLSPAGRALVASHEVEHDRAIRAPRSAEVIDAFAIAGAAALAGTAFEAYGRIVSDSGGGGCGGGGGGCGGCGGGD